MKQPLKDRLRSLFKGSGLFWTMTMIFFLVIVMVFFSPFLFRFEPELVTKRKRYRDDTKPQLDSLDRKITQDCTLQENTVSWQDYSGRTFKGTIKVCVSDFPPSQNNRAQMGRSRTLNNSSPNYEDLIRFDAPKLNRVYDLFYEIALRNQLGNTETAEMIVSCIQSIPYCLVIPEDAQAFLQYCQATGRTNDFAYKYLLDRKPYIDNIIQFGVQSPLEFMYNLKADCDTRTVLLFTILSKFKYDVVILNSDVEAHSILGINIPTARGSYLTERNTGKKYYVWETTAKGFEMGEFQNFKPQNWYIVTTSINP